MNGIPGVGGSSGAGALPGNVSLPFGLSENPYFGAGFGLTLVAGALTLARRGSQLGVQYLKRRWLTTLEVTSADVAYNDILTHVNRFAERQSLHMTLRSRVETSANGRTATKFDFEPAPGRHFFRYKGRWVFVERQRQESSVNVQSGKPFETVRVTTLGRDKSFVRELLLEAHYAALERAEGKTQLFVNYGVEGWRKFGPPRHAKPLSSVVLDDGISENVVGDVRDFLESSEWYYSRGIPYRRGYLLHGPPGCGKSSFIMALAGAIGYDICMLNLGAHGLTDDLLAHSMSQVL
ncbi:MAG: hypothetical protein MHM6MM_000506, partial [Cercozoa sp. M6MM]